ncbi:hypothetical protein GX441_04070 [bacterium]|nr:hypothetical protein [bacterium]
MKKGTIATIIGIAMVLGLMLFPMVTYAIYDGAQGPGNQNKLTSGCEDCPRGAGSCYCSLVPGPYPWTPGPCTPELLYSFLRNNPAYIGEDDLSIYFKAGIIDPMNKIYSVQSSGGYILSYLKSALDVWAASGCPGI